MASDRSERSGAAEPVPQEHAVLLECVRRGLRGEPFAPDDLTDADWTGLDWEAVESLAARHHVGPLVRRALADADLETTAGVPTGDGRTVGRADAVHSLYLAEQLRSVVDAFEAADLGVLPFKGPVLASAVYGDVTRRSFADLDLLVPPSDASRAVDRLESRGFAPTAACPRRDDGPLLGGPVTPPLVKEYRLRRPSDGVVIELRTRVGEPRLPFRTTVETLRDRRTSVDLAGGRVPALSPEDRVVVLAYHGHKHLWRRLGWICDLAATVLTGDVDWVTVRRRAETAGHARKLHVGLLLAGDLLDVEAPPAVVDHLRSDEAAARLAGELREPILTDPDRLAAREQAHGIHWYGVRSSDRPADALAPLRYGLPVYPTLYDYRALPLPRRLFPLYYLLRPVRAIAESIARLRR
jgi:hypothetical protein